ncbi:filopodin, putative [Entamoeba histolytica HM-1:IMSS-B]|uniref:Filopodin, putative n=4 Tax=Entamoeba histolytica TaxID=5759 RepID=C4LYB3_ENTH1|nr:filopodin, putative [Entamoeba histolytica HM-1:IMSS]EAL49391.1 filopodin, putative [Entamoeba histolytica HM-1:IMSS]EMH74218.1 filopodin, putative [Entamoeba histolytica HM-1:IMSS-B]ENY65541.1 filopodin, putative [Entamoeba histolytica HM-1:IMSS-A]GAT93800.1 filopodin putative [Entamoeba histolytica]|eukprot:XP_654777.1 filopodin, putative [Entamoeba histolytica HM-1:IMSS]
MTQVILRIHFIFKDNTSPTASVDLVKSVAVLDTDTAAQIVDKALDKLPERPQGEFILWQPTRHTLFLPNQILAAAGYDSTETLDIRPLNQRFKFELIDKTIKTFQVNVTLTVEKLLQFIGEKVNILYTDEYGLKVYNESTKKESNQWLDPLRVFYEQINSEDQLLIRLKKRFYFRDRNVNDTDQQQLHLLYTDCTFKVIEGMIPFNMDQAIPLVALNCLVEYGSFDERYGDIDLNPKGLEKRLPDIKKYFPENCKKKVTAKQLLAVIKEWKNKSMTTKQMQAKYQYCQLVMHEKTYGLDIFKVRIRKVGKAKEIPKIFGICKDYVLLADEDGGNQEIWVISKIARYAVGKNVFILDLGNHSTNYITLITEEGDLISATLSGYIDLITKRKKEAQLAEKDVEPEYSITDKIEDVPTGVDNTKKKKAVPKVSQTAQVAQVVSQSDTQEQVQLCVDKYQQMTFEETSVEPVQFSAEVMVESAQSIGQLVSDLYSTDKATVTNALNELTIQTDALFTQFCASKSVDFGSCVMNADEDEEQLLVACRQATESAQELIESHENGLQTAVLIESNVQEAEILAPEMFVLQASVVSVQAMCGQATVNDNGSQMLLHELSRAVGEGLFDLAAMSVEMNIQGEKIVEANKALVTLGQNEIAAMRLLAVTSSEEGCQKLMGEMKNTMDVSLANYLSLIESYGVLQESPEMQALYEQVNTIKMNWDALMAGTQMSGVDAEKDLLSMIQNLSAVFNELAQLSDPLVTPVQVEMSIDNLEDILENTKETCKSVAKAKIDEGNQEQVAVILDDFKDVVQKFFVIRDKLESGERGELVEDDCILMRQAMEKLMEGCGMEEVGENMQGLALNSMTKTAVARRIALAAQVRRVIKNGHIKDKNIQKQMLKVTRSMNEQVEEMLKLLSLPVDEQGAQLPEKCKEFAPKSYDLIVEVLETLPLIEDNSSRSALEFACNEAERATFDMARLNNLFNNTKQARKEVVVTKKEEFDNIENEIELLLGELVAEDFEVQTVNVEGVRSKAKSQIEESIKAMADPLKKIRETPLEDLPALFEKIQAQNRKNYRAVKAYASTAKKGDFRKRLLDASKRLADQMKGVVDLSLEEQYDEIAKKQAELADIWAEMDEVMKDIVLDDVVEQQETKEEEIQDAATKELVGAANVINNALGKINAALEIAKKKKEEKEKQLQAEQQAAYEAAVAANEAAAVPRKRTALVLDQTDISVAILEEAQTLINFTSDLISNATVAQKNITKEETIKEKKDVYNRDANWEEGLISAAKTVTGCIQYLVKAANDQVIHNKPSEAMLVACAKSVAANAMQLQAASMVNLALDDPMRDKLASTIKKITDSQSAFVKTVSQGADARSEVAPPKARNAQQLRIMLMEASVNISNIEKELQQAQEELLRMRRARYGNAKKPIPSSASSARSVPKVPASKTNKVGGYGVSKSTTTTTKPNTTTTKPNTTTTKPSPATPARGGFLANKQRPADQQAALNDVVNAAASLNASTGNGNTTHTETLNKPANPTHPRANGFIGRTRPTPKPEEPKQEETVSRTTPLKPQSSNSSVQDKPHVGALKSTPSTDKPAVPQRNFKVSPRVSQKPLPVEESNGPSNELAALLAKRRQKE